MDGCLVDTESAYVMIWSHVFNAFNLAIDAAVIHSWTGLGWEKIRQNISELFGDTVDTDALRHLRETLFYTRLNHGQVKLKPYAREIIDKLKQREFMVGVGTSTYTDKAQKILGHFELLDQFDFIVYGDDVVDTKPSPDIFERCHQLSGIAKKDTIIFEDSLNGLKAANAAQIDVVFVPDFRHYSKNEVSYIQKIQSFADIMFDE